MPGERTGEPVAVLALPGEVDLSTAAQLRQDARVLLEQPAIRTLVVDFSENTFLDSTGMALLIHLHNRTVGRQVALRLRAVPARVLRLLDISGLSGFFEVETQG